MHLKVSYLFILQRLCISGFLQFGLVFCKYSLGSFDEKSSVVTCYWLGLTFFAHKTGLKILEFVYIFNTGMDKFTLEFEDWIKN